MSPLPYSPRRTPQADRHTQCAADHAVDVTRQPVPASQARPSSGDGTHGTDGTDGAAGEGFQDRWSYRADAASSNINTNVGQIDCARTGTPLGVACKSGNLGTVLDLVEDANLGARLRQYLPNTAREIEDLPWTLAQLAEGAYDWNDKALCEEAARTTGRTHVEAGGGWSKWTLPPLGLLSECTRWRQIHEWATKHAECKTAKSRGVERDAWDAAYCRPEALPVEARTLGWGWQPIWQRLSDYPTSDVRAVLVRELEEADAAFHEMDQARRLGVAVGSDNWRYV